ncbi:hypothetical protein LY76DRAFT_620839 [Colletotrichum caudatum]|nr:hypothetical protein LY76DRAFT_620839 [Colletotrichum caudatum]
MKYGEQLEQESIPEWSLHNATAIAIPGYQDAALKQHNWVELFISSKADEILQRLQRIIKKYKKWTGSPTLGVRFRETVLANLKSFTYDFFTPLPPAQRQPRQPYDDGSEAGAQKDEYAIYINPNDDISFFSLDLIQAILAAPFRYARIWFLRRQDPKGQRMLGNAPFLESYCGISPLGTDTDDEYASSDGMPTAGYTMHYATFPSINEQQVRSCFGISFLLLLVAGILISTGRHKLRAEVDAGVTVGVVASMFSACLALGMSLYRWDDLGVWQRVAVYSTFFAACVLNGMLLIPVVGNTA